MLVIKRNQLNAFAQSALKNKEDELFRRERARSATPSPQPADDAALRSCIHQALAKADADGFSDQHAAAAYAQAAIECGLGFATDPLHSWAAPAMQSDLSAADRGQILARRMEQAAPRLTSDESRHAGLAAEQLLVTLDNPSQNIPQDLPNLLLRYLATEIRRVRTLDERGTATVLATAAAIAQTHDLVGPLPQSVFLLPVVLFGLGCVTDPRYAWVGDPELSPLADRLKTVLDRCRAYAAAPGAAIGSPAVRQLPNGKQLKTITLTTELT